MSTLAIEDGAAPASDRIHLVVRVAAGVVIAILATATFELLVNSNATDTYFAWTIKPEMTARLMGVGYGAALYFYGRVITEHRWHRVALGFLPTTLFTWLLLAATFLNFDKFHHGTLPFELWFWVYLLTVVLVPGLWLLNRSQDPHRLESRDALLPGGISWVLGVAGGALLVVVAIMFVWPSAVIDLWPWTLSPLTARTVAGFMSIPATGLIAIAQDRRWSASRILCETLMLGLALLLLAVAFSWGDFDPGSAYTWIYLGWVAASLIAIAVLYVWMGRRARESVSV